MISRVLKLTLLAVIRCFVYFAASTGHIIGTPSFVLSGANHPTLTG